MLRQHPPHWKWFRCLAIFKSIILSALLLSACGSDNAQAVNSGLATASGSFGAETNKAQQSLVIEHALVVDRNNTFKADLNGDNSEDTVFVVNSLSLGKGKLDKFTVVCPWPYYGEGVSPNSLLSGSKISLVISLSSQNSAVHDFILHDSNSPSVLDTEAARELSVSKVSALDAEVKGELLKRTKGELIVVPTEAGIDTYIYWDGKTFVVYEPSEAP